MAQRSRKAILTMNNPPQDWRKVLTDLWATSKFVYLNGQLEVGENGTPHIQGFVYGRTELSKKYFGSLGIHCELVTKDNGASAYSLKEETRVDGPVEFGINPVHGGDRKSAHWQDKNRKIMEKTCTQLVEEGVIQIKDVPTIVKAKAYLQCEKPPYEGQRLCLWIWGPTGTGKSRWANWRYPGAYRKMLNKWFDGYANEESIILEECNDNVLGNYLKLWCDRYPVYGEIKGGKIGLSHQNLCVTSNRSLDEIFGEDPSILEPLKRRFLQIHAYSGKVNGESWYDGIPERIEKFLATVQSNPNEEERYEQSWERSVKKVLE